nr:hypothetical protein [Tanacetum cinerariifolium]
MTPFSEDELSVIATKLGTPLMLDSYTYEMCMQSWGRSSYARALIEIRVDMELKDTIVVAMPKLFREGFYTCTIRVEYEWKPPKCACCKVFGHVQDECLKNIGLGVVKNLKKHSQAPRGVLITLKVGFKPTKKVYRPISKKPNANTSGNKKKDVEPTKEVSNSNLFNVLNLIKNDVGLSTNGGTSNLASKKTNSGGSSFWNVGSSSTTPIVEKVDKIERLIIDGKVTLTDDEGKPLEKVDFSGDHNNEDEVESVNNEMACFLASKKVGYATNSLLE